MTTCRLTVAVMICLGAIAPRAQDSEALEAVCPIDWRAVPLAEAVRELAGRLGTPYILDTSVTDEMMGRRVRLAAKHINGRQAFRWTVRGAGLDAVLVEGAMMIAVPERLPSSWRATGTVSGKASGHSVARPQTADPPLHDSRSEEQPAGNEDRWARRKEPAWVDVPLSRVQKDICDWFEVDVIFHPRLLEDQPLIRLEGKAVDLTELLGALDERLNTRSEYEDGVIWVQPREVAASQPVRPTGEPDESALVAGDHISVLSKTVEIAFPGGGPGLLAEVLSRDAGLACRVEAAEEVRLPAMSGRGRLAELLDAVRLLEGVEWRLSREEGNSGTFLLILTYGSGRSVP